MKRFDMRHIALSMVVVLFSMAASAQQKYFLDEDSSELLIAGTSSIHDWEMEVETFDCETAFLIEEGVIAGIQDIHFSCMVSELTSGKRIMDKKAHAALKEERFPRIQFRFQPAREVQLAGENMIFYGTLSIAGKEKEIQMNASYRLERGERFYVTGKVPLRMSDFEIAPPTAMMGALKTGDAILVKFDFGFTQSPRELTSRK